VRELVTKLGFKTDERALARYKKGMTGLRNSMLAITAVAGAVGIGIYKVTKDVAQMGDNFAKTSHRIGVSTEVLQKLGYSAELAGSSQEGMTKAVGRFARVITDAKAGLETYKRAFARIDLDPSDFETMEDAVLAVSEKISAMPDGIEKTATMMELFGRAGAELINMFNEGPKAIKAQGDELKALGAIMSDKLTKDSEEYQDTLLRMNRAILGLKIILAQKLIPVITDYIKKFKDALANNKEFKKTIDSMADALVTFVKWVAEKLKWLVQNFDEILVVAKKVGIAFGILFGMKILNDIGQMTAGLIGLAKGLFGVQTAGIAAGAAFVWVAAISLAILSLMDTLKQMEGRWGSIGDAIMTLHKKIIRFFQKPIYDTLRVLGFDVPEFDAAGNEKAQSKSYGFGEDMLGKVQQGVDLKYGAIAAQKAGQTLKNMPMRNDIKIEVVAGPNQSVEEVGQSVAGALTTQLQSFAKETDLQLNPDGVLP